MDMLTLADALELFILPRTLGKTESGDAIKVAIGRFGPYVQYAAKKYVSIKEDDPYTIDLPKALELIRAKEIADANRTILDFPAVGIQVLNGRYGPYITDKVKNAKIPKDREPHTLTVEECRALLAAAPDRSKRGGRFAKAGARSAPAKVEEPVVAATTPAPAKAKKTASAKAAPKAKAPAKKTPAKK
jgi:DNA topoisomerase-1